MKNLTYHECPEHGWIEASYALVAELGIRDKITEYSYYNQSKQVFYLEEDYDASTLIKALESRHQAYKIDEVYHRSSSFIRRLPRVGSAA